MKIKYMVLALAVFPALTGCVSYGPEPETVPKVDIARYVGLWHEIASNPVFFNRGLVGVTAEYGIINDTQISVLNTGYDGTIGEANKQSITGVATVVDTETIPAQGAVRHVSQGCSRATTGCCWTRRTTSMRGDGQPPVHPLCPEPDPGNVHGPV